ncbi:pseudouridine-metabolizing bifunctional protein C1861.05 [Orussus abietinus]|uniref:pseudouridine-metabolizing bifunctional protein C1861.05 n=1 Tax=Orussus abietinus TaxID=222816 RepID=UPI0006251318|nr:pseudouridine-metabolizing bifunctional protein C1861.05 [Orussus abietinus]
MYRFRTGVKLFGRKFKFDASITDRRSIGRSSALIYGTEVAAAKLNGVPIVALESTILTHGMPYPDNLKTALKVEEIIRKQGVVPATIIILEGKVHIGTNEEVLEKLSKNEYGQTIKCSRRDLPWVTSQRLNGGTTVSGTMFIAKKAGIFVMATGGIGGVHRGAASTYDVSADLTEFGKTPVAVVCAGVKAILDIAKTLEYLETLGVTVTTIGESDKFPAFYCHETVAEIKSPIRVSNAREAADMIAAQWELGLNTGILLAVPIPKDQSLNPEMIESAIQEALMRSHEKGIIGKDITPFLLKEVSKITGNKSLQANMALVKNNAKVAAEIALHLGQIQSNCLKNPPADVSPSRQSPVVIGGATRDTVWQIQESEIKFDGRTHKGFGRESCGGVARNVAAALIGLGITGTKLLSVVGNDGSGKAVLDSLGGSNDTLRVLPGIETAKYIGIVNNEGELFCGIGHTEAFDKISPALISDCRQQLSCANLIVLDGNPPLRSIRTVIDIARKSKIPVWYEPTTICKATALFEAGDEWKNTVHFISPNVNELLSIAKCFNIHIPDKSDLSIERIEKIAEQLAEDIPVVITTLGIQGVLVTRRGLRNDPFYQSESLLERGPLQSHLYPSHFKLSEDNQPLSVTGCGDCLAAGIICGILQNLSEAHCVSLGLQAAVLSLKSLHPVPSTLSELRNFVDLMGK